MVVQVRQMLTILDTLVREQARSHHESTHESSGTTHQVNERRPALINKSQIAQPALFPHPGKSERKYETRSHESKEDIESIVDSFGNTTGRHYGHHHAEAQVEHEFKIAGEVHLESEETFVA